MKVWKWTPTREKAALLLASGYTWAETSKNADVAESTINRWMKVPEFFNEVDRLSHMVGVAARAERLRMVNRIVRQKTKEESGELITEKDLLDWLKFAQSETDGANLDLTLLLSNYDDDSSD